jgi:hypothetical protein
MIISHVKIIAFQISLFCTNYRFSKTVLYIINRIIHGCLEIPDLFLVLNMISHSFAALTREISCSTLEINLVFPRTMYYSLFINNILGSSSGNLKKSSLSRNLYDIVTTANCEPQGYFSRSCWCSKLLLTHLFSIISGECENFDTYYHEHKIKQQLG